jgi:uncharacterized protein (TIGR02266 family)
MSQSGIGKGRQPTSQRIPLMRNCRLSGADGRETQAFLVNLSVVGAYVAVDEAPPLGQRLSCRFSFPGNSLEIEAEGVVVWLNPRQQHPVHSLPPGIGLKFEELSEANRARIEAFVRDYARRNPSPR